jgi:hypothetical protein
VMVWLNPPYFNFWPVMFIITAMINMILIQLWYKNGLNKYLTILDIPIWKKIAFRKVR